MEPKPKPKLDRDSLRIKIGLRVRASLHRKLKVQASSEGLSMEDKLNSILTEALNREPQPAA